ncbi:MAG: 3-phosphoshikimate 1-carboxyvinyltransferase [Flavobacteriales bacterium]|nr:3-phosphoshikimate 1-carboxyvinyltransferase [Flavobacteriales bacterium]
MITLRKPHGLIRHKVVLTASKSESNRALIIQAIQGHGIQITNLAKARDTETLINLLASDDEVKDVGPAGTTMRFLTAYLSCHHGSGQTYLLTGSDRMKQRPIGILTEALKQLGADISFPEKDGYPPLRIQPSRLKSVPLKLDGSVSSQFISALLMIGPSIEGGLTISFKGKLISRPYVNMTMNMMRYFGAHVEWSGDDILVKEGKYQPGSFHVEGDWSAASYWYTVAALSDDAELQIGGLKEDSLQGDSVCKEIFSLLGMETVFEDDGLKIRRVRPVPERFEFDFVSCPDLAQTIAVVVSALGVQSKLTGLETLRIKETDRIEALRVELAKFHVKVNVIGDEAIEIDPSAFTSASDIRIATYEDHRMAMAFAPLVIKTGTLHIEDPDVVEKSYPDFWTDLEKCGFALTSAVV